MAGTSAAGSMPRAAEPWRSRRARFIRRFTVWSRRGLVTAQWDNEPAQRRGPRRRVYRLSPKGRRALVTARGQWQRFAAIVTTILGAGMINLRKDVERVVRPIRASTWRKNQMREELLAHLEGLLAEEKARRGDDVGAVRLRGRDLASPANSPPSFRPRSPAGSDGRLCRCPGCKEAAAARGRRWAPTSGAGLCE